MKKLLFLSLLLLSTASIFAQLSSSEVAQFYIGMKKSEVEKILQKNAIRRGVSFSLENYKTYDFDKLDMPPEVTLDKATTQAYVIDRNQIVLEKGIVSILAFRITDEPSNESVANLVKAFTERYGESTQTHDVYYWATDDVFIIVSDNGGKTDANALRREYLPAKFIEQLESDSQAIEVTDYAIEEVADSAISVEDYYNNDPVDDSNTIYLPLEMMKHLTLNLDKDELKSLFSEFIYGSESIDLEDYVSEFSANEFTEMNIAESDLTKYDFANNIFYFYKGKCVGNKLRSKYTDIQEINNLKKYLDKKYGSSKALENNVLIWMDEHSIITVEDYQQEVSIAMVAQAYLTQETKGYLQEALTEPKINYDFKTLINITLMMPKEEVIQIIRKATAKDDFDLEICKKEFNKRDLPDNHEELGLNEKNTAFYQWNHISLYFVNNQLNVFFAKKECSPLEKYDEIKKQLIEKEGASFPFKDGITWINDKKLLFLMHDEERIGYAMVNTNWLTQKELDEIRKNIEADNISRETDFTE